MWKRLAVMSLLAMTVGCKPAAEAASAPAKAEAPAKPAPAAAPMLALQPELAKDVAALPRLTGDTAAIRAINADLTRMDGQVRKALPDCFEQGRDYAYWARYVDAPMIGPRFFTVTASDDFNCGGAHPDTSQLSVTYDLTTGRRVDWATLLPPAFAEPLNQTTAAFDFEHTVSKSPALLAWLRDKVSRDLKPEDRTWWEECKDNYEISEWGMSLQISIDAEHEGLEIVTLGLGHAIRACGSVEVMSAAELQRLGAAPELIEAIREAHRAHNWRENLRAATGVVQAEATKGANQ